MKRIIYFFIFISLLVISRGIPLREPSIDKGGESSDFIITPPGSTNDKESLPVYIDKDDILKINELKRLYNIDESVIPDIQFVKSDKGYIKKIRFRKKKTKLGTEKQESTTERSETKNSDIKNVENRSSELELRNANNENKKNKLELLSTVTTEIESTTSASVNFKDEDKNSELGESYRDDFDDPEYIETFDDYYQLVVPSPLDSDLSDDVTPPTLRSDTPHENTEYTATTEQTINEILRSHQDIIPEMEKTGELVDQGVMGTSNSYSGFNPDKAIEKISHLYPSEKGMSMKSSGVPYGLDTSQNSIQPRSSEPEPVDVKDEQDGPEEQLEKEDEIDVEDDIEDFVSNSIGNEYPYTPPVLETKVPLRNQPTNVMFSKLGQASEQPVYSLYNNYAGGNSFGNNGRIFPYYIPNYSYIQPSGLYNFRRSGQYPVCHGCTKN